MYVLTIAFAFIDEIIEPNMPLSGLEKWFMLFGVLNIIYIFEIVIKYIQIEATLCHTKAIEAHEIGLESFGQGT